MESAASIRRPGCTWTVQRVLTHLYEWLTLHWPQSYILYGTKSLSESSRNTRLFFPDFIIFIILRHFRIIYSCFWATFQLRWTARASIIRNEPYINRQWLEINSWFAYRKNTKPLACSNLLLKPEELTKLCTPEIIFQYSKSEPIQA